MGLFEQLSQTYPNERGRWVAKMLELGWTITALAEETGISKMNLSNWYNYYTESERISKIEPAYEPEKLPLTSLLETKRAPIPEEEKTELAVEVAKMKELGWTISALAEETGITRESLSQWLNFYEEAERIKKVETVSTSEIEKLPLRGMLEGV